MGPPWAQRASGSPLFLEVGWGKWSPPWPAEDCSWPGPQRLEGGTAPVGTSQFPSQLEQ